MAQVTNEPMDVVHFFFPADIKRRQDESMRIFFSLSLSKIRWRIYSFRFFFLFKAINY